MKKNVLFIFMLITSAASAKGVDFSLSETRIPDAIELYYGQVLKTAYVVSPDIVADPRKISFHLTPEQDGREFIVNYMRLIGFQVSQKKGVDYFFKPEQQKEAQIPRFSFVYRPLYRTPDYLASVLSSLAPDGKFSSRQGDKAGADVLAFYGTKDEIRRIQQALPSIDEPSEQVYVGGYVYEVQTSERYGNGLQLAADLLSSKLNIQIGGSGQSATDQNFLKFSSGSLTALAQLFNSDSRFRVVSSPSLRVSSGAQAEFSVGDDVPTLGNVSYNGNSSVQSVVYRSSGVLFRVQPVVKKQVIDLKLSQELSNFVQTENGVNDSPTLTKRSISTDVALKSGDIILIGGLASQRTSDTRTGLNFLPSLFSTRGNTDEKTDIVIVLQARRVGS